MRGKRAEKMDFNILVGDEVRYREAKEEDVSWKYG